jgi:hypothetical protein
VLFSCGSPTPSPPQPTKVSVQKNAYYTRYISISNLRKTSGRLFFTDDGGNNNSNNNITTTTAPRADSQKLSLRNRFKARCFERAAKAREKAVKGKRYATHQSSSGDDFTMDHDEEGDEEEEDDEDIMQDEVRVIYYYYYYYFSTFIGG